MKTPRSLVVLVVEGNDAVREMLFDALTSWRMDPIAAATLEEGSNFLIELGRGKRPIAVVFDLHLQSVEAAFSSERFLAEARRCKVQPLICTTTVLPQLTPQPHPYHLLYKPFRLVELKRLLEEGMVTTD